MRVPSRHGPALPEGRGCRLVELGRLARKHDAESLLCFVRRVVTPHHVLQDQRRLALESRAVAAAARRGDADGIAGAERDFLILGEMRRPVAGAIGADHVHGVDPAGRSAERAVRPGAAVVHHHRGRSRAAPERTRVGHAEAAAPAPGPARALVQGVFLEEHRVFLLHHLDGLRLGDADGRAAVGEPVALRRAAVAAAGEEIHHVVTRLRGVGAAHGEVAGGAGRRGEEPIRDRLDECIEYGFRDPLAHLRRAARDRARVLGVEEGPLGLRYVQRLEHAGVDRHVGEDMADREIDRGLGGRRHAVHRPGAGRAGVRHVEVELGAVDADAHVDGERLVHHAVGIDLGKAPIAAVRNGLDLGPRLPRRALAHLADHVFDEGQAVLVEQRRHPPGAHQQRRRLRLDVADALLGHADVGEDDGKDLLVDLPLLVEFYGREAQTLLNHLGGTRREAARHHAAGVRPVACVREPGEVRALVEERPGEAHVHQVGAAEVGVVDGEDVALAHGGLGGDQVLGRELHRADEDRQPQLALGDELAVLPGIDAVGAVEALRDDRAEGRADEGEVHLVADLLQAALHHAESDGIERAHWPTSRIRLPMASREARLPGSTTLVVSIWRTIAGPSKRAPAGRRSRS